MSTFTFKTDVSTQRVKYNFEASTTNALLTCMCVVPEASHPVYDNVELKPYSMQAKLIFFLPHFEVKL